MIPLYDGERIDYLPNKEQQIIQAKDILSFSIDAVLLAKFVHVPIQKGNLIDLCCGNGVIPLLLSRRTKGDIVGVEIQPRLAQMAERNIALNDLHTRIKMYCADINELPKEIMLGDFDVVSCNPPYFKMTSQTEKNLSEHQFIARHEVYCTLEDVIRVSSALVRQKGKVALVHRPERLADICTLMKKYRIEPKRMQLVYPKKGKDANILLIEGMKDGQPELKCLPPLFVYDEGQTYTKEFETIYYG